MEAARASGIMALATDATQMKRRWKRHQNGGKTRTLAGSYLPASLMKGSSSSVFHLCPSVAERVLSSLQILQQVVVLRGERALRQVAGLGDFIDAENLFRFGLAVRARRGRGGDELLGRVLDELELPGRQLLGRERSPVVVHLVHRDEPFREHDVLLHGPRLCGHAVLDLERPVGHDPRRGGLKILLGDCL